MRKKLLSIVLGTAMISTMLAGCGSKAADTTTAATTAAAETTAAETTAASGDTVETTAASGDLSGSLVYWSMWEATEPQGQVIQKAVDKFVADTGVTVDLQFKGRTGILPADVFQQPVQDL